MSDEKVRVNAILTQMLEFVKNKELQPLMEGEGLSALIKIKAEIEKVIDQSQEKPLD